MTDSGGHCGGELHSIAGISRITHGMSTPQEAARRVGKQAYGILLILTDGAVSDINGTKRAIVAASDAPLSIVIIGIGDADFSAMQFLDDFQAQEGNSRDICQFVEFSRHKSNKISLTQATLEEIPDQVVEYFHGRGIKPLPPITGSKVNVLADDYSEDEDIDLSMEYNSEGEICLADNEGVYDDTGYGDFSTYAGVAILPPPTNPNLNGGPAQPSVSHYPGAPNAPYGQPAHPVAQQSQQPYIRTSPAPSPVPYSQQYGAPSQPVQAQPFVVPGNQPSAQAVPPPVFHVQVSRLVLDVRIVFLHWCTLNSCLRFAHIYSCSAGPSRRISRSATASTKPINRTEYDCDSPSGRAPWRHFCCGVPVDLAVIKGSFTMSWVDNRVHSVQKDTPSNILVFLINQRRFILF